MKLAIISHTEHYKTADGSIVGWGPTITEINHLLEIFDTIYHVAMLHESEAPPSALPYLSDRVVFVPLPPLGGQTFAAKWNLIWKAPTVLRIINNTIKQADWFQFRAPTGIGVYAIPFLSLFVNKPGWFKYAGNWKQEHPPLGYRLQRWMLKQQSRKVTINGSWQDQPEHCITFENPCLTLQELEAGKHVFKSFEGKLSFCFVGRLEKEKGVERIINAFKLLQEDEVQKIDCIHFVGNGIDIDYFKGLAKNTNINFKFHGYLPRHEVHEIYKISHVFLLPSSASEGFPKVIAEALNFGCIPIVSNISSISHYIVHEENGFLLEGINLENIVFHIEKVMRLSNNNYSKMKNSQSEMVFQFSFSNYNYRIQHEILK